MEIGATNLNLPGPFPRIDEIPTCIFVFTTTEFSVEFSRQRQLLADGVEVCSLEIAFGGRWRALRVNVMLFSLVLQPEKIVMC